MKQPDRIILGIDPGTTIMGFGIIQVLNNQPKLVQLNELELKKYKDHYLKLKYIFQRTISLIDQYHPDEIAIEAPFFGKNVQSMLKLGRAQGVAMAAGLTREIPITEYSPKKIKMAITGNGNASKEQVSGMLKAMFPGVEHNYLDASDALAVAVCHHNQTTGITAPKHCAGSKKNSGKKGRSGNWEQFIQQNPERLK